MEKEKQKK
jgi:hypothetical protein